jgi:hypothetical protein
MEIPPIIGKEELSRNPSCKFGKSMKTLILRDKFDRVSTLWLFPRRSCFKFHGILFRYVTMEDHVTWALFSPLLESVFTGRSPCRKAKISLNVMHGKWSPATDIKELSSFSFSSLLNARHVQSLMRLNCSNCSIFIPSTAIPRIQCFQARLADGIIII